MERTAVVAAAPALVKAVVDDGTLIIAESVQFWKNTSNTLLGS